MGYRDNIKREFDSKVVEVARVTRVVAGGKRMRFRALVVVGDRKGRVGIGLKKGVDVADAIGKATNAAQRSVIEIQIKEGTIPHLLNYKYKAARIFIKPAKPGTGIIAGGPLRAVLTLSGIRNITSKMLGSSNKVSNVRAVYLALQQFNRGGRN